MAANPVGAAGPLRGKKMLPRNLGILLVATLAGCADDPIFPGGCESATDAYCWKYLGVDDWVGSIELTPRGLFVGTSSAGVLQYAGETKWEERGLSAEPVHALMYHPPSGRLFAGYGSLGQHSDVGVFSSGPDGRTWHPSNGNLRLTASSFAYDDEILFWGANTPNILKSDDGGREWRLVHGSLDVIGMGMHDVLVSRHNPGVVYAVGESALFTANFYRSSDNGESWQPARLPPENYDNTPFDIDEDPTDPNRLWLATSVGLLTSEDVGATWNLVLPLYTRALNLEPDRYLVFGGRWLTSGIDERPVLLLLVSTDGGATWTEVPTPEEIPSATVVKRDRAGRLYIGTGRGLWLLEIQD